MTKAAASPAAAYVTLCKTDVLRISQTIINHEIPIMWCALHDPYFASIHRPATASGAGEGGTQAFLECLRLPLPEGDFSEPDLDPLQ